MELEAYEMSMLLDFYGQLLTENQYKCLDMHCNQDLSLAEIGEELQISRQGVHDFIKRGKLLLLSYEEKLGLLQRFRKTADQLSVIRGKLAAVRSHCDSAGRREIDGLDAVLQNIISEL